MQTVHPLPASLELSVLFAFDERAALNCYAPCSHHFTQSVRHKQLDERIDLVAPPSYLHRQTVDADVDYVGAVDTRQLQEFNSGRLGSSDLNQSQLAPNVIVDFVIEKVDHVYPMIPAGGSVDQLMEANVEG